MNHISKWETDNFHPRKLFCSLRWKTSLRKRRRSWRTKRSTRRLTALRSWRGPEEAPLILTLSWKKIDLDMYMQKMYTTIMKYDWNPEKNEWLKKERKLSFEEVVFHLSQGDVWKVADHPDQQKYPGQKVYFVIIENYIYLVPHIERKEHIFLKTIIPSRKATKVYQREKGEQK